jgi:glutamate/tyrosine decarboxylase-like PLP-dependent enzyme
MISDFSLPLRIDLLRRVNHQSNWHHAGGNQPSGKWQACSRDNDRSCCLLFDHSLLNGHPKFSGYITSSPAPIGTLADLLAAAVNPNVGAQILSPIATEIEKQTIQWLATLVGLPPGYGGIFVSGGNMANLTAFLAARTAKAPSGIKENGLFNEKSRLTVYCSTTTYRLKKLRSFLDLVLDP